MKEMRVVALAAHTFLTYFARILLALTSFFFFILLIIACRINAIGNATIIREIQIGVIAFFAYVIWAI